MNSDHDSLLSVKDLSVSINTPSGVAFILHKISFEIKQGEVLGLIGESGCGKSTVIKSILGLLPGNAIVSQGQIIFKGQDLLKLNEGQLSASIRGQRIGFIPQDPAQAFNPNFNVGEQILEIWRWHGPVGSRDRQSGIDQLVYLLGKVQIADPISILNRYPHQFSGGQRQRLLIAAALLCKPDLVLADEPTTALDVTTQQQILHLLADLGKELGISVLLVTHDFGVVSQICDKINIMYAGQTVEYGPKRPMLQNPEHPYTIALMNCHPNKLNSLSGIPGVVASTLEPPTGCRFLPRCSRGIPSCSEREAKFVLRTDGRYLNCTHYDHVI